MRITLRPWAASDATALREAIDEDVDHLKPWLSWTLEEPATLERTRERLREWVDQFRRDRGYRFAVTPRDRPSRILGGANLNCRVGPNAHDVGYWVRKSAARKGVATAAVSALVVHAFTRRKVDRLVARCDVANAGSMAFARALGFQLVGSDMGAYPDGRPRPVSILEMTRESYRAHHGPRLRDRARSVDLVTEHAED